MDINTLALPIALIMIFVALYGLYDVSRRPYTTNGSKALWSMFIIFFNLPGLITYYLYGRQMIEHDKKAEKAPH